MSLVASDHACTLLLTCVLALVGATAGAVTSKRRPPLETPMTPLLQGSTLRPQRQPWCSAFARPPSSAFAASQLEMTAKWHSRG